MLTPLLVSAKDAATALGMSRSMLYLCLSSGRINLKPIKFGAKRLYRVSDIENFVKAGCSPQWRPENA